MPKASLRDELMRQDGLRPGLLSDEDREKIQDIIARDQRRVGRARWAATIAWVLLGVAYVVGAVLENAEVNLLPNVVIVIAMGLFYIAIFLTIAWYVRSNSLKFRQIQAGLTHIQEQLEHLQKEP